jgi:squalene-hopene/tetraprenyl-beta-curcumene cyclase
MKLMLTRFAVFLCIGASPCLGGGNDWNAKAAAAYLDGRAEWWMTWPNAARDHGTFCISCHTAAPYALSRPLLRHALGESGESSGEQKLIANVSKRVRLWSEVKPFYPDSEKAPNRSAESRATEAVLNALILAGSAARDKLSPELPIAFDNMWAAQIADGPNRGAFPWLDFHNRPWEAGDSQYYGSALAAVAVGMAPADFRRSGQNRIDLLVEYLRRSYGSQSLANKTMALWAGAMLPGLLTADEKVTLLRDLAGAQNQDGGWSLTALAGPWKRSDGTILETASDGYATGLVAYAMARANVPRTDRALAAGLRWLTQNQSAADGRWVGYSLNKNRDLNSDVGRFMSDAATAYAVLALSPER